jgi:F-box protein 9
MADNPELESFRRKWREEVAGRTKPRATPPSVAPDPQPTRFPPRQHETSHRKDLEEEGPPPASFDPEELAQQVGQLTVKPEEELEEDGFTRKDHHEPRSALEHFERAVEKEDAGNLGDSLHHYRRAYRVSGNL